MELSEKQKKQAVETKEMVGKLINDIIDFNEKYPPSFRVSNGMKSLYYKIISIQEGIFRIRCYSRPISESAYRKVPEEGWFLQHGNSDTITEILNRAAATDIMASADGKVIYFLEQMRDNIECIHRTDGPAYCSYDESSGEPIEVKYFLKGNEYSEEEFDRIINTSGALAFMGASLEQVRAQLVKETKQLMKNIEEKYLFNNKRAEEHFGIEITD